jgi:crossover junction endodeoxyribonuclease RuvC
VIILGIDPGLRTTGYGVISVERGVSRLVEAGIIRPKVTQAQEKRLLELYNGLRDVVIATVPDVMVVEEIWIGERDPSTALIMGHARGVLCVAAAAHGVPVEHLAHTTVKRALTGSGASSKLQVKKMVVNMLGLTVTPEPDDVSDALAVALAHANMQSTNRLSQRLKRVS